MSLSLHVNDAQKYWYDVNGNATKRITDATYDLIYDAENRLTQLKKNGTVSGTYVYDGDGVRVKETAGGVTRVFIGAYFEWTRQHDHNEEVARSLPLGDYYAGGTRVATPALATASQRRRQCAHGEQHAQLPAERPSFDCTQDRLSARRR